MNTSQSAAQAAERAAEKPTLRSKTMKFRKKPDVIEAMRLFSYMDMPRAVEWIQANSGKAVCGQQEDGPAELLISTLEGAMAASVGDWIIKGVNGEFYPCKPDIFEKTYEPVPENESKCPTCGQEDTGQTGEYPCRECGLPTLWDNAEAKTISGESAAPASVEEAEKNLKLMHENYLVISQAHKVTNYNGALCNLIEAARAAERAKWEQEIVTSLADEMRHRKENPEAAHCFDQSIAALSRLAAKMGFGYIDMQDKAYASLEQDQMRAALAATPEGESDAEQAAT